MLIAYFALTLILVVKGDEEPLPSSLVLDDTDLFLIKAMSKTGMKEAFGDSAVSNAVEYDPDSEDYSGWQKIGDKNIQFVLYTRGNTDMNNGTEIYIGLKDHLLAYGYDPAAPTKIICHGFNSDYKDGPGGELVPAYFNATSSDQPLNVISINWASMAGLHTAKPPEKPIITNNSSRKWYDIFYFPPARNTEIVGNLTGALIQFLVENVGADVKDFHLVGHSLGAHIMGYAGRFVQEAMGVNVARITALDPAGPCFERLRFACFRGTFIPVSKENADFVDVIHTNAGRFGMTRPVGHVDFYPNRGYFQPGCPGWWRPTAGGLNAAYIVYNLMKLNTICAHIRSTTLMKDSILYPQKAFSSRQCSTWKEFSGGVCMRKKSPTAVMGEPCSSKSRGVYFLKTGDTDPYNIGIPSL